MSWEILTGLEKGNIFSDILEYDSSFACKLGNLSHIQRRSYTTVIHTSDGKFL